MKDLLTYLVKALSERPDEIAIDEKSEGSLVSFTVRVPQPEMGRVIGKAGKTARAIRVLVNTVAYRNNKRANVEFQEEGNA
ncbi:MAG TPA: KH domain-containing protein [bacterium]|nr:KH domain-containing protein [bacterium]